MNFDCIPGVREKKDVMVYWKFMGQICYEEEQGIKNKNSLKNIGITISSWCRQCNLSLSINFKICVYLFI